MKEIWKDIIGYEGFYSISNLGKVRREKKSQGTQIGRILKTKINYNGYEYLILSKKNNVKRKYIHRLLAETFIGKSKGLDVNHKNSNRSDNRLSNLEYVTRRENLLHGSIFGFVKVGEDCNLSTFKEKDILKIRKYFDLKFTINEIAQMYGKRNETIRRIVNRTTWRHIK
jgi:hypothetical protein